ncbi:MAG: ATP-binding protein [Rhodothermales bacterium]
MPFNSTKFKHLLDAFIAEDVRKKNREDLFHARLVAALILLTIPFNLGMIFLDSYQGRLEYAAISVIFLIFCILCGWILKRTGKYQGVGIALLVFPILSLTRACLLGDGLTSIYIPLLFMLPSLAFIMAKREGGLLITVLTLTSFVLQAIWGPQHIDPLPRLVVVMLATLFCTASTLVFYNLNHFALARVTRSNQQLEIINKKVARSNEQLAVTNEQLANSNDALREAQQKTERALQFRSAFLATMSHEIRTPMNGVIGMTSLLTQTVLTDEQRDYIDTIRVSGDSLLTIINDILDFSKIESGQLELEEHPFSVGQCIEEALDLLGFKAEEQGLELAYQTNFSLHDTVIGDITRLRQILVNLVSNAIKFTQEGGVTVEAMVAPADQLSRFPITFSVTDTGIGIPEARMDRLFEPFRQVDASTTRQYGGTGLGLAICKRLCEAMGGSIDVSSVIGEGSVFQFTIYVAPCEKQADVTSLAGEHILLIEPHAFSRNMLLRELTLRDAEVTAVCGLFDGLPEQKPDKILMSASEKSLTVTLAPVIAQWPEIPVLMMLPTGKRRKTDELPPSVSLINRPLKPEKIARMLASSSARQTYNPTALEEESHLPGEMYPLRILLVEDNVINQKVALRLLEGLGFTADIAGNGEESLDALIRQPYDLVLMDVQMPIMDGLTATRKIRASSARRQPYILGVTANVMEEERRECLSAGMDDYITKPIVFEELERALVACGRSVFDVEEEEVAV